MVRAVLVFSGCSLLGVSHRTHEPDKPSEYPGSVGEVAWTWKPSRGADRAALHEMGEGVLVLLDTGLFALPGKTGEELWSYHGRGQELVVGVTGSGEYVVLHDEETSQTTVVERDTGQIAREYTIDLSKIDYTRVFSPNHLSVALTGVTGDTWIIRQEGSVSSYDLATGEAVWEVPDAPNCSDVGQVDDLSVQDDVVVAATTCYEQPEGQESVAATSGQDFISELVGFAPESGEELWRIEHSIGRMPHDSLERTIASRPGGWLLIDFNKPSLGYSLLDIEAQEVTHLETQRPLWFSPDGDRLGLWDTETGQYRVQDRSGQVEQTLAPELVSMGEDEEFYAALDQEMDGGVVSLPEEIGEDHLSGEQRENLLGTLGDGLLTLSDERTGGGYDALPESVRDVVEGPDMSGDSTGRGALNLLDDWRDQAAGLEQLFMYTDEDLEGGVELSTRLMQTASREIDILSGPGGGSDDSTISGLLDVATRNEDANYVILTGEYPPGVDADLPWTGENAEELRNQTLERLYSHDWGMTERLFEGSPIGS